MSMPINNTLQKKKHHEPEKKKSCIQFGKNFSQKSTSTVQDKLWEGWRCLRSSHTRAAKTSTSSSQHPALRPHAEWVKRQSPILNTWLQLRRLKQVHSSQHLTHRAWLYPNSPLVRLELRAEDSQHEQWLRAVLAQFPTPYSRGLTQLTACLAPAASRGQRAWAVTPGSPCTVPNTLLKVPDSTHCFSGSSCEHEKWLWAVLAQFPTPYSQGLTLS